MCLTIESLIQFQISIDLALKFPAYEHTFFDAWPSVVTSIFRYVEERAKDERTFAKTLELHGLPMTFESEFLLDIYMYLLRI